MDKTGYWNQAYADGFDYRQVGLSDVEEIVSLSVVEPAVLDVGCGTGELARQFHQLNCAVTGIDLSDVAIKKAKEASPTGIDFKVLDVEEGSLKDLGEYDIVCMKLVFAFMKNKGGVISRIKTLLKPDGVLVIINPVITNYSRADLKTKRISVDDDVTMQVENFGFSLISKSSLQLSDFHQLTTYIFRLTK